MSYRLKIVTPNSAEVISLADMKLHLRVDNSDEDTLISALINAAETWVEMYTRRTLLSQEWIMWLDGFPPDSVPIYMPTSPIISIDKITYQDEDDATRQIIFATTAQLDDITSTPPRITLLTDQNWPNTVPNQANSVKIEYTAGYGTDKSAIPPTIIAAMKLLVGTWFENRENVAAGYSTQEVPYTARALLDSERIYEVKVDP